MLQSLSLSKLLGLGCKQGQAPMQQYHTTTMIHTSQQSNLSTNILMLDQGFKAHPPLICWTLVVNKEGHLCIHIMPYL